MIRDTKRLQYQFTDLEKRSMIRVCDKFPSLDDVQAIRNSLAVDGSVVLSVGEAFVLAGLVRPYYHFMADKLEQHPGIEEDRGIPQIFAT